MMKKISILTLFSAAVVLASCSKDNNETPTPEDGVKTYMSLSVDIAKANTRAHYGDLEATADESVINNVTVFVFNSNDFLEEIVTFDNPGDMTKTFTVTTGAKTFLAAANISGLSFTKGTTSIETVKAHKLNIAGIDDIAYVDPTPADSRFWMTSLTDATATLTEITDPAQVGGSSNDVTIRMGRAAAKAGVYYNPTKLPDDGTLNAATVEYRIHNNQKGMYLFAHNDAAGNRKTPFYDVAFAAGNYFDNATSTNDGYLPTTVTFDATLNRELHDAPSYMVENSNKTISNYTVTYASVRGVYTQRRSQSCDGCYRRCMERW